MSARTWTLAGRMTRLFTVSLVGVVLLVSVPSAWFLARAVEQELDALLHEELDELAADFHHTARDAAAFADVTARLNQQHPSNRFGWRLWNAAGNAVVAETGATALLPSRGRAPDALDRSERLSGDLRWRAVRLRSGEVAELVVDGSAQVAMLRRYGFVALLTVLAGAAASVVVSLFVYRHASNLLQAVAERARSVRSPEDDVDLDSEALPEEVRGVALALQEMLTNIRDATAQSQLMTAGLAHELRSPIQNLLGETEVALLMDGGPEQYRAVLRSQLEELHALGDAVDNLVTLLSAPDGRCPVPRERFDLAAEAELRLARESAAAERRGVRLELIGSGNTTLVGDREALLRAVRNLAANGIEWSPTGGVVRVELDGSGDRVVVTVDDAGPGIEKAARELIFNPFFRGPTASGRRAGYGLGLAIVRSAVESHGGEVEVESSPAGGARFRLKLPRDGNAA